MAGPTRHEMLEMHRSHDHATGDPIDADLVPTTDGLGGFTYEPRGSGSSSAFHDYGNLGAAETLEVDLYDWVAGTLDDDVAITVSGFTVDDGKVVIVELLQDGTGGWAVTWDADVEFTGDDQPDTTPGSVTFFTLWTRAGDSTIYAAKVGGGTGSALSVADEGVEIDAATDSVDYVGAGVEVTSTGAGAVQVAIPGGATASDTGIWRPLLDGATGAVIQDGGTGEANMGFGPA